MRHNRESTEQSELARGQGRIGGLSLQQGGKDSLPADGFDRFPRTDEEKESFAGIMTDDAVEDLKHEAHSPWLKDYPSSSLLDQVMNLGRKRRALEGRIRQQFSNEVNKADIQSMIDQLIESSICKPDFSRYFSGQPGACRHPAGKRSVSAIIQDVCAQSLWLKPVPMITAAGG